MFYKQTPLKITGNRLAAGCQAFHRKIYADVQQCQQIAAKCTTVPKIAAKCTTVPTNCSKMYNSANKLQHFPGNLTSWVSHLETRRSVEKYSFARRIPRQALSPDQIQEIRGLRGKMSSAEAKSSLALDPIGSTKSESRPKTTPLLCPQSSRCRLSKTSLPMHLWWRKISTSAWGGWRLAWRCSERFWKKIHIYSKRPYLWILPPTLPPFGMWTIS